MNTPTYMGNNIWQGRTPLTPFERAVVKRAFDVVVLCAEEAQLPDEALPGVELVHAGFSDDNATLTRSQLRTAQAAADEVVKRVREGKRVLVACYLGCNRSGLVTAFALHKILGWSGHEIVEMQQAKRPCSLMNPAFESLVRLLPTVRYA